MRNMIDPCSVLICLICTLPWHQCWLCLQMSKHHCIRYSVTVGFMAHSLWKKLHVWKNSRQRYDTALHLKYLFALFILSAASQHMTAVLFNDESGYVKSIKHLSLCCVGPIYYRPYCKGFITPAYHFDILIASTYVGRSSNRTANATCIPFTDMFSHACAGAYD